MRDKLKDLRDGMVGYHDIVTYYLYDIAESVRELLAARNEPLDLTPGELQYLAPEENNIIPVRERISKIEFQFGAGDISASDALKELGYESPEELRAAREKEVD